MNFIGSHVVAQLAARHEVAVVHRGKSSAVLPRALPRVLPPSVRSIVGDRDRLTDLSAAFHPPPDVVLDMISGDEHHARSVLNAFRGIGGRLVTASSIDVYRAYEIALGLAPGPLEPIPLTEDSPLRTVLHPYRNRPPGSVPFDWVTPDYDKILVERIARSEPTLPSTILRLPMVYGPGDPLHRFHEFLKSIDEGQPDILIDETWARWRGPMGYVENVAAAIALAVTHPAAAGRTYNVAEPDALSWEEWARALAQSTAWQGSIVTLPRDRIPARLIPPFNAAQHWIADSSRIRNELGYRETIPRAEALVRTVAWERSNR